MKQYGRMFSKGFLTIVAGGVVALSPSSVAQPPTPIIPAGETVTNIDELDIDEQGIAFDFLTKGVTLDRDVANDADDELFPGTNAPQAAVVVTKLPDGHFVAKAAVANYDNLRAGQPALTLSIVNQEQDNDSITTDVAVSTVRFTGVDGKPCILRLYETAPYEAPLNSRISATISWGLRSMKTDGPVVNGTRGAAPVQVPTL